MKPMILLVLLARIVDEEDEFIATIVSSDKDLLQLINDELQLSF